MATQRLTVATLLGVAAEAVAARFARWRVSPSCAEVDEFCINLRNHAFSLQVIYFVEWIDRWLMAQDVPGPNPIDGSRFQVAFFTTQEALDWADQYGTQFNEQVWFAEHLRAAAGSWKEMKLLQTVVAIREVIGPSADDDDIRSAATILPDWLAHSE